jgi:MFS transporter, ACS family, D-galactonate transporter
LEWVAGFTISKRKDLALSPIAIDAAVAQNAGHLLLMAHISADSRTLRGFVAALLLLSLAILINYVDRGNLSIAAPLLKAELHISDSQLGVLFSAFFITYTAFIFVSGWLVDRYDVNWVLAAGFAIWSAATAATGLVEGFAMLFLMRLLLGVGESVAFPAVSKILAYRLPEEYRGFANGVITAGMKAGPAVGTFGAGLLMARYGWRSVFIGIGLTSLVWLPLWLNWKPSYWPAKGRALSSGPQVMDILQQRSFWGATLGHFCGNYAMYFMVTWLPSYLVRERGLSMQAMAKIAGAYYLVDSAACLATGWVTDFLIRQGQSVTRTRKAAMVIGPAILSTGLMGCALAGPETYVFWLMTMGVGMGIAGAGIFAFSQTLAGPKAAGRWSGLQNGTANLAGILSPAVAGLVVDWTSHFTMALVITAAVSLIGAAGWTLIIGKVAPIEWETPSGLSGGAEAKIS